VVNLSNVRLIPRTRLTPGTVIWAHVPFEDTEGEKTRPAVVIDLRGRDVVILPGTTAPARKTLGPRYVEVTDLDAAGLYRPTGIRQSEVVIDLIEIIDIVGTLSDPDASRILEAAIDRLSSTSRSPTMARSDDQAVA
jgi:hypothetical protein